MSDNPEIVLKGRLKIEQKNRLAKLFDMMYRPSELAAEIGFSKRQVYRVYIPLWLPHERDEKNHIWINGVTFRDWVKEVYKKRKLKNNQFYCLSCKKPMEMINPERVQKGRLVYYLCRCGECGKNSTRILQKKRRGYDQSG
jgi:hypothetical protein